MKDIIDITVIIPFYYGNSYMRRLLTSIKQCADLSKERAVLEVIIVNDSPNEEVWIPQEFTEMDIRIIVNEQNIGIQKTRINGLKYAQGEWILFLDQDDELVCDGFQKQISLKRKADVVVGNGIYKLGSINKKIYKNEKTMRHLIQEKNFLQIRNLIPSPGECLIRKKCIPEIWKENILVCNGADDWFLWIVLFKEKVRYVCNEDIVYIHNDSNGKNLSSNLLKMKESSLEMLEILKKWKKLNLRDTQKLERAILFKYKQDTEGLSIKTILEYFDVVIYNAIYKYNSKFL